MIIYMHVHTRTHARARPRSHAHTPIHIKIMFFMMLKSVESTSKVLSETEVYLFINIILVKNLTHTKIVLPFSVS